MSERLLHNWDHIASLYRRCLVCGFADNGMTGPDSPACPGLRPTPEMTDRVARAVYDAFAEHVWKLAYPKAEAGWQTWDDAGAVNKACSSVMRPLPARDSMKPRWDCCA